MKDELLKRLQAMPADDPLWDSLLWLTQKNIDNEIDAICVPDLSDAEAHRGRGRISAFRDIQEQLNEARKIASQTT